MNFSNLFSCSPEALAAGVPELVNTTLFPGRLLKDHQTLGKPGKLVEIIQSDSDFHFC